MEESPKSSVKSSIDMDVSIENQNVSGKLNRQGHIMRKEKGRILNIWRERFVILKDGVLFFYFSDEIINAFKVIENDNNTDNISHINEPKIIGRFYLNGAILITNVKHTKKKFAFSLESSNQDRMIFYAQDERQKNRWVNSIKLNMHVPHSTQQEPTMEFIKNIKPSLVYISIKAKDKLLGKKSITKQFKKLNNDELLTVITNLRTYYIKKLGEERYHSLERNLFCIVFQLTCLLSENNIDKELFQAVWSNIRVLISKIIDGYEIPFAFNVNEFLESVRQIQKNLLRILKSNLEVDSVINTISTLFEPDLIEDFFVKKKWKECSVVGTNLRNLWDNNYFE